LSLFLHNHTTPTEIYTLSLHDALPIFTYETKCLLEYFQAELRSTEVFRPIFDAKRLDAITTSVAASTELLTQIEAQLADLTQLIDRKSTRLNSSHVSISYAVFCL